MTLILSGDLTLAEVDKPVASRGQALVRAAAHARRFTWRPVADAHQAVEDGTAASKIVVDIAE